MKLSAATQKTNDILARVLWMVIGLSTLTSAVLGAKMLFNARKLSALNLQSSNMEKQLSKGNPADNPEDSPSLPHGYATLRALQAAVTRAANKQSCQLTEFKSGTNIVPFISKYRKDAPVGAWSQLDAHFTLLGKLRDINETLQSLNDVRLPVEVDSIDLTREGFNADGSARVSASVQLRAITQGASS